MNKTEVLNDYQKELAASHIYIVKLVIYKYIEVNESVHGFAYDDLFQEGCLWLCKAAVTYDSEISQFKTYANVVIKNGLLTYCKRMCKKQKMLINLNDLPLDSDDAKSGTFVDSISTGDVYDTLISDIDTIDLLASVKSKYHGVARLGIEALELKILGYTGADIARMWGVKQNHVGAWISRAKRKLDISRALP